MALDKPITDVTETDLQNLITNQIPEGTTIEYKATLSLDKPEEKKEFVRDIAAFANTRGGDVVYGIKEDRDRGIPQELCGVSLANADLMKQRLENLVRDGASPRIYGMQIQLVSLQNDNLAVVIRMPRSFNAPHMVVCGGDYRFYYRTNAGRERLDVTGLRTLFGLADTVAARTQAFRAEGLSKIQAGDTPEPLLHGPKHVLHMVPFDAFAVNPRYDLSRFIDRPEDLPNNGCWATNGYAQSRYNFDGVVSHARPCNKTEPTEWYTQCFRNGIIEAVNMQYNPTRRDEVEETVVIEYENCVLQAVRNFLMIQREMGVAPPVFALLTLLGVKGRRLSRRDNDIPSIVKELPGGDAFKEEHLVLPEVVFEDFECEVSNQMEPVFEIVWNAAGLPRKGTV